MVLQLQNNSHSAPFNISMSSKKLFQILLPLYDNEGKPFSDDMYKAIRLELTERFGGLTAYSRSPATGLWKDGDEELTVEKLIVYEVIADDFEKKFWKSFKEILKAQFRQEDMIIRCTDIEVV